ncbi:MAG: glutamate synthase [Legionellales bacterium RIFCSPHIGHO2_12_FULL_35_11]|nr:MAG: glutamate synthase [Legionellales bacterium RIFCSPHIGHO2_12_FULL_35_11]
MRRIWFLALGVLVLFVLFRFVALNYTDYIPVFIIGIFLLWLHDVTQKKKAIIRNFPVIGHFRYLFEFIRPEIQQYFIANDEEELPFNREVRSLIHQRAKNVRDTIPFGTSRDIYQTGYRWVLHSLDPKSVEDVEPRLSIGGKDCKKPYLASRLNISGMSFGALSAKAVMALNLGAKMGGFAQNTGEGGLSKYHLQGGDIVFQIGTGYFGCRNNDGMFDEDLFKEVSANPEVKMIEIKLSQGAKPSHGGILPAVKVTKEIAEIRKIPFGKDALSPPAHSAFKTPTELLGFVKKLREMSGGKPIGFKLCVGKPEDFVGICKAMLKTKIYPDFITVDGAEGGTGAAPLEFTNNIGEPLNGGLRFVHNVLVGCGLRDEIKIICSGKIATGFDMVMRIAMGADICNSARAMMMAAGCVQAKQCNANTCPTGVTTQKKRLQWGLVVDQKKHHVFSYHKNTIHSFLEIVGAMGLTNPSQLKPEHIIQRISYNISKPLSELFFYLEPKQLLGANIPDTYKNIWEKASAESF